MNRTKIIAIVIGVATIIVGILLYNRSQMAAKSKAEAVTSVPVTVMTASAKRVSASESLVGTITATNDVAIISETQGRVTGVFADVGRNVSAGSTLVQVDDELKKASLASAETSHEKAKRDLERFENLAKQQAATDQQVEGARLAFKAAEAQYIVARREYRDTRITSPIAGIVTARPVEIGTYIQKGMPVANVVDISKLKVKLNVAERDAFRLKVGDEVTVTTDVYPGITFPGRIRTIGAKADEAHTYPVEITLPNPREHPLRSGMFGRVNFPSIVGGDGVAIPREALVGSMKKPQVFVVDQGVARLRDIVVGAEVGTELLVMRGLNAGETFVVDGQNNLKEGSTVTIVK